MHVARIMTSIHICACNIAVSCDRCLPSSSRHHIMQHPFHSMQTPANAVQGPLASGICGSFLSNLAQLLGPGFCAGLSSNVAQMLAPGFLANMARAPVSASSVQNAQAMLPHFMRASLANAAQPSITSAWQIHPGLSANPTSNVAQLPVPAFLPANVLQGPASASSVQTAQSPDASHFNQRMFAQPKAAHFTSNMAQLPAAVFNTSNVVQASADNPESAARVKCWPRSAIYGGGLPAIAASPSAFADRRFPTWNMQCSPQRSTIAQPTRRISCSSLGQNSCP